MANFCEIAESFLMLLDRIVVDDNDAVKILEKSKNIGEVDCTQKPMNTNKICGSMDNRK